MLIGNVGRILGGIHVFPDARLDDGLLDVGVLTASGRADWLRVGTRALLGPHRLVAARRHDARPRRSRSVSIARCRGSSTAATSRGPRSSRSRSSPSARQSACRRHERGAPVSGIVDTSATVAHRDEWVRAWPLNKPALIVLAKGAARAPRRLVGDRPGCTWRCSMTARSATPIARSPGGSRTAGRRRGTRSATSARCSRTRSSRWSSSPSSAGRWSSCGVDGTTACSSPSPSAWRRRSS